MPIYEYQCSACGHHAEVLRKISDAPLTTCPVCGKETFDKQLSAAGFQLKGSGWYATDFKGSSGTSVKTDTAPAKEAATTESTGGHSCGTGGCGHCA